MAEPPRDMELAERRLSLLTVGLASKDGLREEDVNPFWNKSPRGFSCGKLFRQVFVAFALLPFRILLLMVSVLIAVILCKIGTCGLGAKDIDSMTGQPLAGWRRAIIWPVTFFGGRFALLCLGFWWIPVKGRCATREEAPIICPNHVSGLVDGTYLFACAKLAEQSYSGLPILAGFMIATQSIFVDRSSPESRQKAKDAIVRRCEEHGFPQTVIFPEGTCTNGRAVVQFKGGAFNPGKPVQPVAYTYHPSPCGGFDCSFTEPLNMGSYLLGMMMQLANFMHVEYLPVIKPTPEEIADDTLFANRVQRTIAQALKVPATKHAGEDLVLATAARKLGLPFETGLVHWQTVTEGLAGMRAKGAVNILKQFKEFDTNKDGEFEFEEFSKVMKKLAQTPIEGVDSPPGYQPSEAELRDLFNLLDKRDTGKINFQDYLSQAAILNGLNKEDRAAGWKMAFEMHSKGDDTHEFDKETVREFSKRVHPHLASRFDELWSQMDANENGMVSKDEFMEFAEANREALQIKPADLLYSLPITFADPAKKEKKSVNV